MGEGQNEQAKSKGTRAILIGDFEKEKLVNQAVNNLAKYKENGTPYTYGQDIDSVIDTVHVHFAHSHNCRLLQLADTYMWTRQLQFRTGTQSALREDLKKFIKESTDTNWPHRYKYWPSK